MSGSLSQSASLMRSDSSASFDDTSPMIVSGRWSLRWFTLASTTAISSWLGTQPTVFYIFGRLHQVG
jgi:hypothetical protein